MALFYKLFSNLLAAGHSPVESLSRLNQEPFSEKLRARLQPFLVTIPTTASLADCLSLKVFALDTETLNLFKETTLPEEHAHLLQALSARYSQESWMNQLHGHTLYWPLLYFIVGWSVFYLIISRVLPMFAVAYEDMEGALSTPASLMLSYGYGFLFLLLLLMIIFLVLRSRPTPLRGLIDRLRLVRPWGILIEKIAIARFTHMLTLLLPKKVAPRHALIMAAAVTGNVVIEHRLQRAFTEDSAFQNPASPPSVADLLKSCPLVPGTFIAALDIAEKTHTFDETLPELSELSADLLGRYSQTLNNSVDLCSKIFVFLIVLWIAFAVYLPVFSFGALI
jgi:type II secretory pathway component PulF